MQILQFKLCYLKILQESNSINNNNNNNKDNMSIAPKLSANLRLFQYACNNHDHSVAKTTIPLLEFEEIEQGLRIAMYQDNIVFFKQLLRYHHDYCLDTNAYNSALNTACATNKIAFIEYLLIDCMKHTNIHYNNDTPLLSAISNNANSAVDFLLNSIKIKEHANINARPTFFMIAYINKNFELIQNLVFRYNINAPSNDIVETGLKRCNRIDELEYVHKEIDLLFGKRQLHQELTQTLPVNGTTGKTTKV